MHLCGYARLKKRMHGKKKKKMQHYLIWWTQLVSKRFCASHRPRDLTNSPCMGRVFHCGRRSAAAYRWSSPQTGGKPAGNVWKRWPPCSEMGKWIWNMCRRRTDLTGWRNQGLSSFFLSAFLWSAAEGNESDQHNISSRQLKAAGW